MSSKTREFTPAFVIAMITLTIVALLSVLLTVESPAGSTPRGWMGMPPFPQWVAGGITVAAGLSQCEGQPAEILPASEHWRMIGSILVWYITIPTIFLLSLRNHYRQSIEQRKSGPFFTTQLLGISLCMILLLPMLSTPLVLSTQKRVVESIKSDQKRFLQEEQIRTHLASLASDAQIYCILTGIKSGKRTFVGYSIPSDRVTFNGYVFSLLREDKGGLVIRATSGSESKKMIEVKINIDNQQNSWR